MRNERILRVLIIITNILMVAGLVLSLIFATNRIISFYWASIMLFIIVATLDINEWSKIGLDVDKKKSRFIKLSFDDNTAILLVYYGSLFLLIQFFEMINKEVTKNNYVIIGFYIMTVIFELLTYVSIYKAKRDTAKLLNNNISK